MKRRKFLNHVMQAGLGITAGMPVLNCSKKSRPEKPNIIFIMVDDMGYANLGCYGSTTVQTPYIDQMAKNGIKFTDTYTGCTVCAPSRSVLMTGHHMGHTSVRANSGGVPLLYKDITIAEILKKAGYATGGFGKWGLGDIGTTGAAEQQGFDTFLGYYNQVHAHRFYPDYLIHNGDKVFLPGNDGFYNNTDKSVGVFPGKNPQTGKKYQFSHYLIFKEMKNFIRENKDKPFFCYAPWTPPHGEFKMPQADPAWDLYKNKPWTERAKVIAAMDSMVDRQVGEILSMLKELGIDRRTIVFFCSDNGAAYRLEDSLNSSGPFRGRKRSMYEGGIRTPMVVYWPGYIQPGRVSDLPWYFPDVMPTLAELAGVPDAVPADIDGISVVPALLGEKFAGRPQQKHDFLYWEWQRFNRENIPGGFIQAVRMGKWKAVRPHGDAGLELYDLENDPDESENIAAQHPRIMAQIREYLSICRTKPRPQVEPETPKGQRYR